MKLKRLLALTLVLSASAATSAIGQSVQLQQTPPPEESITWPATARPKSAFTYAKRYSDGAAESVLRFSISDGVLELEPMGLWIESSPSSRFSSLLEGQESPSIKLGLSRFGLSEFLKDLSIEEWSRYVASLVSEESPHSIVSQSSNFDGPTGMCPLGAMYREIVYETVRPEEDSIVTKEVFFQMRDELIVFTFQGNAHTFPSIENRSRLMLTRLNLLDT